MTSYVTITEPQVSSFTPSARLSRVSADSPSPNRRVLGDTIVLHNTKASDSAVYQCEASNTHGTLLSNANIMIMSKCDYLWSRFLSDKDGLTDGWNLVLLFPIKQ